MDMLHLGFLAMKNEFIDYWQKRLRLLDVHYHARPDSFFRRYSAHQVGCIYTENNSGVVLKSHLGSTAAIATCLQEQNLAVFGSIVLNHSTGGLSLRAIKTALSEYQFPYQPRLLVHLPTIILTEHKTRLQRSFATDYAREFYQHPISIVEENGRLRQEIKEIIAFAEDHPIVLSSGHATKDATLRLIDAVSKTSGVNLMLNQPANPMTGFSAAELKALGKQKWLYIEQCALTYYLNYQTKEDMFSVLNEVHQVIYSSDLGQPDQPTITDWFIESEKWFKEANLTLEKITEITLKNPLRMLSPIQL